MMRAYSNEDIVDKIKTSLLANGIAFDKVKCLRNNESCSEFDDDSVKRMMKYDEEVCKHERYLFCLSFER